MNIEQAKRFRLEHLLSILGHAPQRQRREEVWYLSPFRDESQPSFKINLHRNNWYDFGEGTGGDVIDFVRTLYRLETVSEALGQLDALVGGNSVPPPSEEVTPASEPDLDFEITSLGPVKSKSLFAYLHQREIPLELAAFHLQEMHYRRGDRDYFALAFANDGGGHELRNRYFKGSQGRKDITTFPGRSRAASVFEGFFDFLSALAQRGSPLESAVIVLNSTALWKRAASAIEGFDGVETVHLYRDRDPTGLKLLAQFREALPATNVEDMAHLYVGCQDFNEHWVASAVKSRSNRLR